MTRPIMIIVPEAKEKLASDLGVYLTRFSRVYSQYAALKKLIASSSFPIRTISISPKENQTQKTIEIIGIVGEFQPSMIIYWWDQDMLDTIQDVCEVLHNSENLSHLSVFVFEKFPPRFEYHEMLIIKASTRLREVAHLIANFFTDKYTGDTEFDAKDISNLVH